MDYKEIKQLDRTIQKWASSEIKNIKSTFTFYKQLIEDSFSNLIQDDLSKQLLSRSIISSSNIKNQLTIS
jgi:hypothetical protein